MSIKVRVPQNYFSKVPNVCVCCGNKNPTKIFIVSQYHFSSSLTAKFPLCERCDSLIKKRKGSCLIIIISIFSFFLFANLLQNINFNFQMVLSLFGSFIVYFLLRLFIINNGRKGLLPDEILLQEKAIHAVKIVFFFSYAFITFKFENDDYGAAFALLNNGKIVG